MNYLPINYVMTMLFSISQIVHVVSILAVPIRFLSSLFQSKEVNGAWNSFNFLIIIFLNKDNEFKVLF